MRVLQGIILSLFIHFFVVWSAQYAPKLAAHWNEQKPISVEILDKDSSQNETKKERQIVRQADVPEELKTHDSEDPLAFLSERTQRVKKQTRALASGMTQNRSGASSNSERVPQNQEPQTRKPAKLNPKVTGDLEAFTPKYRKTPRLPQRTPQMEGGVSTLGEALPNDVAVGSFTALNTDRYLYYSFFSRIEDMIRFRWETSVRDAIDTTPPERLASNVSGIWTTQVEILLKRNGELDSAVIMKESGMKSFDRAAAQAFVQAGMFPNPPEEMVESDGLIHLKYSFQVHYSPNVLSKSSE